MLFTEGARHKRFLRNDKNGIRNEGIFKESRMHLCPKVVLNSLKIHHSSFIINLQFKDFRNETFLIRRRDCCCIFRNIH
jgi:hypothetical protein